MCGCIMLVASIANINSSDKLRDESNWIISTANINGRFNVHAT